MLACFTALGAGLSSRLSGIGLADRVVVQSGILGPLFALLIWQLARGDGALRRALSAPVLLTLGEASYALYILQEPMFELVGIARKRLAPTAAEQPVFVIYLVLLLVTSLAAHRFVELPVRSRILSWFASRRVVHAVVGVGRISRVWLEGLAIPCELCARRSSNPPQSCRILSRR